VRTFAGWVYCAFVLDVFSRRVVGWQVSTQLIALMPYAGSDATRATFRSAIDDLDNRKPPSRRGTFVVHAPIAPPPPLDPGQIGHSAHKCLNSVNR
jgi:transposase InsO family protein